MEVAVAVAMGPSLARSGSERAAAPAVASQGAPGPPAHASGARRAMRAFEAYAGTRKAIRRHWNSAARPRAGRPRAAIRPVGTVQRHGGVSTGLEAASAGAAGVAVEADDP